MLKVETLRTAHELDGLKSRWMWLEKQCDCTLFQSYELNRRAAKWFAGRETPQVVVAESDSGLAIIPAVRRERELGLIGETLFDYRDVLSAGDPKILEQAWGELALLGVPLEVTALRGLETRARWSISALCDSWRLTRSRPKPVAGGLAKAFDWCGARANCGRLPSGSIAARLSGVERATICSAISCGKT
jgi:hypothetical protein